MYHLTCLCFIKSLICPVNIVIQCSNTPCMLSWFHQVSTSFYDFWHSIIPALTCSRIEIAYNSYGSIHFAERYVILYILHHYMYLRNVQSVTREVTGVDAIAHNSVKCPVLCCLFRICSHTLHPRISYFFIKHWQLVSNFA